LRIKLEAIWKAALIARLPVTKTSIKDRIVELAPRLEAFHQLSFVTKVVVHHQVFFGEKKLSMVPFFLLALFAFAPVFVMRAFLAVADREARDDVVMGGDERFAGVAAAGEEEVYAGSRCWTASSSSVEALTVEAG